MANIILVSFGALALLVVVLTRGRLGYSTTDKKKNPITLRLQPEEHSFSSPVIRC